MNEQDKKALEAQLAHAEQEHRRIVRRLAEQDSLVVELRNLLKGAA